MNSNFEFHFYTKHFEVFNIVHQFQGKFGYFNCMVWDGVRKSTHQHKSVIENVLNLMHFMLLTDVINNSEIVTWHYRTIHVTNNLYGENGDVPSLNTVDF